MIRASRSMVLASAATALTLHAAGLWVSDPRVKIEIEGGAGAAEAILGSSFADMVAGAAQPVSNSTVTPNRRSDAVVNPEQPGEALRPETPETASTPPPRRSEAAQVDETAQATSPEEIAQASPPEKTTQVEPAENAARSAPEETAQTAAPSQRRLRPRPPTRRPRWRSRHWSRPRRLRWRRSLRKPSISPLHPSRRTTARTAPDPTETTAAPARTEATAAPVRTQTARSVTAQQSATPAPQEEVVEAAPEAEDGLQASRRPQARPREIEEAAARQAPELERKAEVQGNSGSNAERDATRGSTSGSRTATAARQGRDTTSRSEAQGNAAASNYPGAVMRHLARVARPRSDARGAALVQFAIATGGRLASVSVARSSGSTRLDRAALTVIRRAAPFPPPPQGAQTRFSVKIEGR